MDKAKGSRFEGVRQGWVGREYVVRWKSRQLHLNNNKKQKRHALIHITERCGIELNLDKARAGYSVDVPVQASNSHGLYSVCFVAQYKKGGLLPGIFSQVPIGLFGSLVHPWLKQSLWLECFHWPTQDQMTAPEVDPTQTVGVWKGEFYKGKSNHVIRTGMKNFY